MQASKVFISNSQLFSLLPEHLIVVGKLFTSSSLQYPPVSREIGLHRFPSCPPWWTIRTWDSQFCWSSATSVEDICKLCFFENSNSYRTNCLHIKLPWLFLLENNLIRERKDEKSRCQHLIFPLAKQDYIIMWVDDQTNCKNQSVLLINISSFIFYKLLKYDTMTVSYFLFPSLNSTTE